MRVADVYGNRSRPADPSRVRAKFRANAGRALAPAAVARLEAAVDGLGRTTAVADLSAALRTVRRAEEQNA